MNEKQKTKVSKFLSLILRHDPGQIGITLDSAGWIEVEALLQACRRHGRTLEKEDLEEIVRTNDKKRFAFSADGRSIRASQGHSVEVSLGYAPQVPPPLLFHGTATRFVDSIQAEGLQKGDRHHVHLSASRETAKMVGLRHGRPAVLTVRAAAMIEGGHCFFLSENGVWLTEHVPVEYIEVPS